MLLYPNSALQQLIKTSWSLTVEKNTFFVLSVTEKLLRWLQQAPENLPQQSHHQAVPVHFMKVELHREVIKFQKRTRVLIFSSFTAPDYCAVAETSQTPITRGLTLVCVICVILQGYAYRQ